VPINPNDFHPGGHGTIVPIGPGPFLPNVNDDATAIVGYVLAHGCDASDRLRTLVTLFQTSVNALITQNNQVHGLNEALLPVDGALTGKTEQVLASYAGGLGLKFTSCAAIGPPKTGGIGPQPQGPQTPAAPASSNTALYVGVGALALVGIVALVMVSGGKKHGKRSNPVWTKSERRQMRAGSDRWTRGVRRTSSDRWIVYYHPRHGAKSLKITRVAAASKTEAIQKAMRSKGDGIVIRQVFPIES
jgi:hypothetical protein